MIRPSGDIFPAPLRARAVGVRPMAAMQRAGTKKAAPYYAERPSEKYLHGGCISIGGLIKTQVGGYNHP